MGSQDYVVSDVLIRGTGFNSNVAFQIRGDASGQPSSSVLFTFDPANVSGGGTQTVSFPAGSPFTLTGNSTYWLVGSTSSGQINWQDSSPNTLPSGSGATFGTYALSNDSGSNWTITAANAPIFQLEGTLAGVPEPSSLALVGTVACVGAVVGWRRRRTGRLEQAGATGQSADGT
jgi:hypothetical protein